MIQITVIRRSDFLESGPASSLALMNLIISSGMLLPHPSPTATTTACNGHSTSFGSNTFFASYWFIIFIDLSSSSLLLVTDLFIFNEHSPEPDVLVTLTKDLDQILYGVHIAAGKIRAYIDVQTAMAVALLALKNRENKKLSSRLPLVHTPIDRNSPTPSLDNHQPLLPPPITPNPPAVPDLSGFKSQLLAIFVYSQTAT